MLFSLATSEGDVAVVVQSLEDGFLFRRGIGRARGSSRCVVERIAVCLGGKKFHILHDNVDGGAFYALIVFIISQLNASADGDFVAFFGIAGNRFRRAMRCN